VAQEGDRRRIPRREFSKSLSIKRVSLGEGKEGELPVFVPESSSRFLRILWYAGKSSGGASNTTYLSRAFRTGVSHQMPPGWGNRAKERTKEASFFSCELRTTQAYPKSSFSAAPRAS
jgi:hypothetical protein